MAHIYQVALLLEGRPCLVIGGGRVAARKVRSLLNAGAKVRVVAREATEPIRHLAEEGILDLQVREFVPEDLEGAFLAIVATDDADLNEGASAECHRRGVLVNVVDQPALCSFYVPAVVERGPISIAISTGGASPALARRLRERLEEAVGEEYGALAALMGELRGEVLAAFTEQSERAEAWRRLLDSDVLDLLAQGETEEAKESARRVMGIEGR